MADHADGNIYQFQPGGGVASAATRLTSSPIPGGIEGLVATGSGQLYLARYDDGDVVQIDPGTGAVLRTVARVPCATGLAIDPASGDLFVSENQCGSTVFRVSGYQSGPGTVSSYASAPGVDGLAVDQDGSLYAESDGNVVRIAGTASPVHGAVTDLAHVPTADGLAFGAHSSGEPPYLVANRNDGIVTKVDFSGGLPSQTDIFSGGSRGDFVAVDSAGCLYITQPASIVRISGADETCALEPSTPGPPPQPSVIATALGQSRPHSRGQACTRIQSLRLRVRQQGRVRLRSATVYVNGRAVKRLNGVKVTAPFVLTHLPESSFTVEVVAVTTTGKRLVTSRHYANCAKPPAAKCMSKLIVSVPQRRGDPARLIDAYVNAKRVSVVRGKAIRQITLTRLPHGHFTVKLITHYAHGRPATSYKTYAGCPAGT